MSKLKYTKEEFETAVKSSSTIKESLKKMGIQAAGGSYKMFHRYAEQYGVDFSHFTSAEERVKEMVRLQKFRKKSLEEVMVENSTYSRSHLKKRLYDEGLKERKCETHGCGQTEEWMGNKMSLILDHINGVNNDHRIENLRILCPNCAATLSTHCRGTRPSKRKEKKKELDLQRCKNGGATDAILEAAKKKRKSKRPLYDELKREIKENGYSATGRRYGVSDNAIRKWVKFYEKQRI
ncbi:MAG: HNH endonuclease [bacterium]|nr:HNH endonuclease [bacterium]